MPVCIVSQCGGDCDEQSVVHKGMVTTQLGKATCAAHVGHRGPPCPFDCDAAKVRLTYVCNSELKRSLRDAKCKSRWPSDPAYGWKYPSTETAAIFFKPNADHGFIAVNYDQASDDESSDGSMLVLWKDSTVPLANASDASAPPWAEHGVRFVLNAEESRLICQGPICPRGTVPARSRMLHHGATA